MWVIGGASKVYKTLKLLIGCLAVKLSIFVSKNNFHQIFADILRNCNENVKRILSSWLNPLKWVTNSTIVQHCFGKINCGAFINFASILDKQSHGCEKFHEWMCIIMKLIETSELTIWRVMKRSAAFPKDSFRFQPWINLNPNMINIMQM